MKSFTVESILGVHHDTTPDDTPVQHDAISQRHDVADTQQQQTDTDSGSFCQLYKQMLSLYLLFR